MRILPSREWLILAVLSLLVLLLRLPSLELPFDNDNGSFAYHARLILGGEPLYSTHHPGHHLPGIYYAYALAFLLFGDSLWAVKLWLILGIIVSVYLLYWLGILWKDRGVGLLAALFYTILSAHLLLLGQNAPIELFANLPRLAAVLVLIYFLTRKARDWIFIFVGVLSAFAFLFKAVYLSSLALAGLTLLVEWWSNRRSANQWQIPLRRLLWLGAGFLLGLLPVIIYLTGLGLWPRIYLGFVLGQRYVGASAGPEYIILYPLMGLAINNVILLIFSLAGLGMIVITRRKENDGAQPQTIPTAHYLAAWYILSLIEAGVNRTPYPHYYLLLLPPLALLAGWFVRTAYIYILSQSQSVYRFALTLAMTVLMTLALLISTGQNFSYYHYFFRYKLGLETYQSFLIKGWPADGPGLIRVQQVADYIRTHTSPSDQIYYWSDRVQLYYLAQRRAPFDLLWPVYATDIGPYQEISDLQTKYLIFEQNTKYIIIDRSQDKPPPNRPDWFNANLLEKYVLETVIADQEIYRSLGRANSITIGLK
jgi:4-amino-4-deoxy-L-arabinose transferase-like glycosyltransferase